MYIYIYSIYIYIYIYTQRLVLAPGRRMPSDTPHVSSLVCSLFSDVFHMLAQEPYVGKPMFSLGETRFSATCRLLGKLQQLMATGANLPIRTITT